MEKKKSIQKEEIIAMYMDYVLENNQEPASVYKFCKDHHFEESLFYMHYASFEAIKSAIFAAFFINTIKLLNKNDDYQTFDAQNKLLSFYFTFFENLTANRSYVIYALKDKKNKLASLKQLDELRSHFKNFIGEINIETIDIKQEKFEKVQKIAITESTWIQLLLTLKFWIEDNSTSFEKTDLFIEKSVKASFDLMDTTALKSVIDLGKFLFKEKVKAS